MLISNRVFSLSNKENMGYLRNIWLIINIIINIIFYSRTVGRRKALALSNWLIFCCSRCTKIALNLSGLAEGYFYQLQKSTSQIPNKLQRVENVHIFFMVFFRVLAIDDDISSCRWVEWVLRESYSTDRAQSEHLPNLSETCTGVFLPKINPPITNPDRKLLRDVSPHNFSSKKHEVLYNRTNEPRFLACSPPNLMMFLS